MKKTPTEEQPSDAWAGALMTFDRDLRRRGAAEKTRRAYAIDLGQFARWATGRRLGPEEVATRDLRRYEGQTCALELAFNHDSRLYVYEVQPDWYEEYLTIEDEIASSLAEEDLDEGDSLGGYFSKN